MGFKKEELLEKGPYNLKVARTVDEALVLLKKELIGFLNEVALTRQQKIASEKPRSGYLPPASIGWGDIFSAFYFHTVATAKDIVKDFKKVADEIEVQQAGEGYNPNTYITSAVFGTQPHILTKLNFFLERFPPFFVVANTEYVNTIQGKDSTLAYYGQGANVVVIRDKDYENYKGTDNLTALYTHETFHYITSAFRKESLPEPWLVEGMTEYLTQRAVRHRAVQPDYPFYSEYTRSIYYLAKLVGDEAIAEVHLTGDMSKIRSSLDSTFGFGTYNKIISADSYQETMAVLTDLCKRSGFDTEQFDNELRSWGKKV